VREKEPDLNIHLVKQREIYFPVNDLFKPNYFFQEVKVERGTKKGKIRFVHYSHIYLYICVCTHVEKNGFPLERKGNNGEEEIFQSIYIYTLTNAHKHISMYIHFRILVSPSLLSITYTHTLISIHRQTPIYA